MTSIFKIVLLNIPAYRHKFILNLDNLVVLALYVPSVGQGDGVGPGCGVAISVLSMVEPVHQRKCRLRRLAIPHPPTEWVSSSLIAALERCLYNNPTPHLFMGWLEFVWFL